MMRLTRMPACVQLKQAGKKARLQDGLPPIYLRRPAIYALNSYTNTTFHDLDLMNVTGLGFRFPSAIKRRQLVKGKRQPKPSAMHWIEPRVFTLVSLGPGHRVGCWLC